MLRVAQDQYYVRVSARVQTSLFSTPLAKHGEHTMHLKPILLPFVTVAFTATFTVASTPIANGPAPVTPTATGHETAPAWLPRR